MAGKLFLRKVSSRFCRYLVGQKFRRNCSISLRFIDKRVFAFYAEIQDGRQKWRENGFREKPVDSAYTLWVKTFIEIALCCSVSEINMLLRSTQYSAGTLWVKTFVEITLSTLFLRNTEIQLWLPKVAGKRFLQKVTSRLCSILLYLTLFPI